MNTPKAPAAHPLGEAAGSDLTLEQAKHFEWLYHGTTQEQRDKLPDAIRKQVETVLGHELTIS